MEIPKFGTFRRPKRPSAPAETTIRETRANESTDDHGIRHKRRRRRSRSRSRERVSREQHSRSCAPDKSDQSDIFIVDRKGDEKNLIFGSVHRYSIPPYHRVGLGSVLGAAGLRIDPGFSNETCIILNFFSHSKKYREKYSFARIGKGHPRLLKIRPGAISHEAAGADYIPLRINTSKKRKISSPHAESESDTGAYRSIRGKARAANAPLDNAFQYVSESDSTGSEMAQDDASARRRNVELSRKVEQFPHDIEAWLALIAHQETLLRGEDESRRLTVAEANGAADIKIHMYEKALKNAKTLFDRERLLQGMMAEGSKIWDVKIQIDRWEQISKDNINSLLLWKSYLDFRQSNFTSFRYDEVRAIYLNRFKLLSEKISSVASSLATSLYQQLVYTVLRFTLFAHECGYSELAVAIWQGLLELNFCQQVETRSTAENEKLFQEFWDSEVPRIGENNAQGWAHFLTNSDKGDAPEAIIDKRNNLLDNTDIFQSWFVAEQLRSKISRVPARTMDEVVDDDPFRVILFSDIQEFLTIFPKSASLHESLIDAFLCFCRLPPMAVSTNHFIDWSDDTFLRGEILDCNKKWIESAFLSKTVYENGNLSCPISNFQSAPESLFDDGRWFSSFGNWRIHYASDTSIVSYSWVRNTLKQLIQQEFRDDLGEYYLAFMWRNERDSIKESAKSLLKQNSNSLRLYNAYAMIEWSRGNKDAANRVFSAAISMADSKPESISLWRCQIWTLLEDGNNAAALKCLLSIPNGAKGQSDVSHATILRSRNHLISQQDYLLSTGDFKLAIEYMECIALVEYLSLSGQGPQTDSQGDVVSAISVFNRFSDQLASRRQAQGSHELFLQSASRLLFRHARVGPFRPAFFHKNLLAFLRKFPRNTIFLSLYSWNEQRSRIDNRVRNLLTAPFHTESLTTMIFHIWWEIGNGTIHSARAAFEHAILACPSSAEVWKLYILFSRRHSLSTYEAIWYRAIRACPWAKELYMTGFESGIERIEFNELKRTWRVMGEKDLRVHVDLDELFDGIGSL